MQAWRSLPNPDQWQVTPERHHSFSSVRPFFCQVEAVETAIWLTEVAPQSKNGKRLLDYLAAANRDANPELTRLALKLATGAGMSSCRASRWRRTFGRPSSAASRNRTRRSAPT